MTGGSPQGVLAGISAVTRRHAARRHTARRHTARRHTAPVTVGLVTIGLLIVVPLLVLPSLLGATPASASDLKGPGIRPPLDGSSCGITSIACSVDIAALPQIGDMWCVPAAASAIIGGVADQSYLAWIMGTSDRGTPFRRVPRALNPFSDHAFTFSHGRASYRDADGLLATVRYQVGVLRRALILGVEGDLLPYWPSGVWGLHAVVVSGWRGAYLLVWDPLHETWNLRTGGFHLVLPVDLARAGAANSRAMIR